MTAKQLTDQSISTSTPCKVLPSLVSQRQTQSLDQNNFERVKIPTPSDGCIVTVESAGIFANSVKDQDQNVSVKSACIVDTSSKSQIINKNKFLNSSATELIAKELHNFDPSTPETLSRTSTQEDSNKENVPFLSQYMELHAIHPVLKSFLVGSISGTCSTVLFQPLDLLKTRLQTLPVRHGIPSLVSAATASSNGFFTIVGHIVRDEKLFGLWKGITPSLTRCIPGVGLYFASIHSLKLAFDITGEPSPLQSVLLGITGRSISGIMMIPFTVIKTRFESTVYHYGSIREALYSIYCKEGVRGLTCGLLPTLLRDAPFSGLYLLMYTTAKKRIVPQDWLESTTLGPLVRFSCGVIAGIGASLVTQPADVIKTKMQLYPDKFNNIPQVVAYVYKKYGAQGYFKGLMPRMIRRTLVAAMSWTVYEQVMKSIGLK